jgi:DNA-binding NtrC family response regulator
MIDDQPDIRTMVSIVLRVNHFDVVEAASAAAGLKEFEASKFDLAIVDIFLQGIVAISGMTMLDFVNETPELSNVVCLQKPFRPADLVLAVEVATRPRSPGTRDVKVLEITP